MFFSSCSIQNSNSLFVINNIFIPISSSDYFRESNP